MLSYQEVRILHRWILQADDFHAPMVSDSVLLALTERAILCMVLLCCRTLTDSRTTLVIQMLHCCTKGVLQMQFARSKFRSAAACVAVVPTCSHASSYSSSYV